MRFIFFLIISINCFSQEKLSDENSLFNNIVNNTYLRNQKNIPSDKLISIGDSLYNNSKNEWQKVKSLFVVITAYESQFKYKEALDVSLKAIHITEENNLTYWKSRTYGQTATLYAKIGLNKESLKYFDKAFQYSVYLDHKNELLTKSMILQAESFLYQNLNDYSKVLQVNKQALSIVETLKRDYPNDNFQSSSITAYINTATSYYHLKNYSKSKKYYALALNEINTSKEYDRNFYAQTCIKIAMAELKAKKPDLDVVLTYINKAKEESKNINNKEIELEINTTEADYFRLKNKYKIVDSLNTKINNGYKDIANSKIKSVQNIFNESQKKYENEKIKSFHLIVSFVTSLIIITTIVFLYYFNLKKKSQQFNLILEKIKKDKNDGIQTDILINKNKIRIMSEEKESELLEKINEFENGDLFTQKTFSMAQMSTLLESNPKYINYVLSHHKNMNFSDYINQLRINYIVKKLIDNPQYLNYKISYLADSIGFSSNSRFAYIFKKQLNITPSEFISLLKNKNKL